MYLLKLGMLTAIRDLVWRKHEAENIFTVANLQHSWCQSKELYQIKFWDSYFSHLTDFLAMAPYPIFFRALKTIIMPNFILLTESE